MGFMSTKLGRLTAIFILYLLRPFVLVAVFRTSMRRISVQRSNPLGRIGAFIFTRLALRVDRTLTDLGTQRLRRPLARSRPPKARVKSAPIPFGTHSGSVVVAAFRAAVLVSGTRGRPVGRSRILGRVPVEGLHSTSATPQRRAVLTLGTHVRAQVSFGSLTSL
jgi:nucleotide-binding universal stress UspA family protein